MPQDIYRFGKTELEGGEVSKLKKCPFCGVKAEVYQDHDRGGHETWSVSCDTDRCAGNLDEWFFIMTKQQAIEAWNKRNNNV